MQSLGPELTPVGRTEVRWEGRRLAFFAGNDYHRFSTHPQVVEALRLAATEHGVGCAGSRVTTANHPLYLRLEAAAARFFGTEDAVLCATGYLTNMAVVQAVAADYAHILLEEGAHSSLTEAAAQSGLPLRRFSTRQPEALGAALKAQPGRSLVLCDGVAPSTGHLAPLAEYARLAGEHEAGLLVDDAHGLGTLGPKGRGSGEEAGLSPGSVLQTGTLSKAFGCYGGLVLCSRQVAERVRARSTAFSGATPIPLPVAAAALRALDLLEAEPQRLHLLQERARQVKHVARECGFNPSPGPAPICSLTFVDPERAEAFRQALLERGVYPSFIRYPGAPAGGHFRFTVSSEHTPEQLEALLDAIRSCV